MLNILFKHKIYEYCINLIFKLLSQNFQKQTIPKPGEIYSQIIKYYPSLHGEIEEISYHNCLIERIDTCSFFGEPFEVILFRPSGYKSCIWVDSSNSNFFK